MPVIRKFHGLNIYHFTGECDVTIALEKPPARAIPQAAIDQQNKFIEEFLDWLRFVPDRMRVLKGYAGSGKLQPLTEPVLTPDGWRVMGEIKPGDMVVSKDGSPTRVLNVFPGADLEIYRVSFSDGTSTECCIDHLWEVQTRKQRQNDNYQVLSLREMLPKINGSAGRTIGGNNKGYCYSVDLCQPVQFKDKEVPLHPFVLGWLLGDGYLPTDSANTSISIWKDDAKEVFNLLKALVPDGVTLSLYNPSPSSSNVCRIRFSIGIQSILASLGVQKKSGDKFVPKPYLFNSTEKRKQLLAGLLDTDGTAQKHPSGKVKLRFSSSSKQLTLDVIELVRSLGGAAQLDVADRGEKGVEYKTNIRLPFNPFILKRKADAAQSSSRTPQHFKKKIVSAEFIGRKDGQCILVDHPSHLYLTRDYTVTHNTHTIKRALIQAKDMGLLNGAVYACAPTHQAKSVLAKSLYGAPIDGVSTSHSLLNLRPHTVEFLPHDEERLGALLKIPKDSRTSDESNIIDWLQIKQNKAAEEVEEFVSEGSLKKLDGVRLIVVDEGGMNNEYMFGLFCGLIDCTDPDTDFHPDLQILFMGDPAQLPPIGEKIGKVFSLPSFSELTEVVRYTGAIKEYCNQVRDLKNPNYDRLHRMIDEDETLMCLPSYEILREDVLREIYEEESVRFIASTNKRVADLNYLIRSLLKGKSGNSLFYEPGDSILTLGGISHGVSGSYSIACSVKKKKGSKVKPKLEINTSTLIELGDPVSEGEVVETGSGDSTFMTDLSYKYTSPLGTKFERLIYRYRLYASGDSFSPTKAICLINPEQFALWKEECDQLLKRARSTQSRGKTEATSRGQEGETAKEVWKANDLKSWFKRLDGSTLEPWEYKRIRDGLWQDYYNLYQFADNASYSYVSTCHRAQGATVDVIVIDTEDILGTSRAAWKKPGEDELWDTRKLLYTAASRAAKQLVFML